LEQLWLKNGSELRRCAPMLLLMNGDA
jgi:hypothetical protein